MKRVDWQTRKTLFQGINIFAKPWYIWLPAVFLSLNLVEIFLSSVGLSGWISWLVATIFLSTVFFLIEILAEEDVLEKESGEIILKKKEYGSESLANTPLRQTGGSSFFEDTEKGLVLVDFWAVWSMPLPGRDKILRQIEEGVEGLSVLTLDVEIAANSSLSENHRVNTLPTLLLFRDGREIDRFVGDVSLRGLCSGLAKHL